MKRVTDFGETDESDEESDEEKTEDEYCASFDTDQLSRITKLAGLNTNMQVYPGSPLLFRSDVGQLGKISIYIKSKEQLQREKDTVESDEEDF